MRARRASAIRSLRRAMHGGSTTADPSPQSPPPARRRGVRAALCLNAAQLLPCDFDSKQLLDRVPRGAYTTARTVGLRRIFELDAHVQRLLDSARFMHDASEAARAVALPPLLADVDSLRPVVTQAMSEAAAHWERLHAAGGAAAELKVTVVCTWPAVAPDPPSPSYPNAAGDLGAAVYAHCQPLAAPRPPPVKVVVWGVPRANARAKDSEWCKARKPLEELKPPDCEEVIMTNDDGELLEGTQTNFFAVDAETGALVTAGEHVLEGTVRGVAIRVCEARGVPVQLRPPTVADMRAGRWAGCALSSTSRLFLPVDELSLMSYEAGAGRDGASSPIPQSSGGFRASEVSGEYAGRCREIAQWVAEAVDSSSSDLPEPQLCGP